MSTDATKNFTTLGALVTGRHCNKTFIGTVWSTGFHTINHRNIMITVNVGGFGFELDGRIRETVTVSVDYETGIETDGDWCPDSIKLA